MQRSWLLALLVATSPALADANNAYTKLDFKNRKICTDLTPAPVEGEPNDGAVFECQGYGKYVVQFTEGDLRSFVSFGKDSVDTCAGRQTFSGFNSVGDTIEWRLKGGKPIATILRWHVSYDPEDSSKLRSWLVVTKLEAEDACHMAYVEGAYPKANEVARKLADTMSGSFHCKGGVPKILSNAGTNVEGLASAGCP